MSSSSSSSGCFSIAVLAIFACLVIFTVGGCFVRATTTGTATFTVTDKTASGGTGRNGHKYLIFTNRGVFEDTDNILRGKTDSSDLYGSLKIGHTYTCKTAGVRFSLASWYRNLLHCEEVR